MKKVIFAVIASCMINSSYCQLNLPNASPDATFKQLVGFTDVEVKYSRPSARGRTIFGSLVPYNELWRTGAHDATTIHFSDSIKVNGTELPAGIYSLFTIPGESDWTIIINKDSEMHGTSEYSQDQDAIRFMVKSEKSPRYYETFTIELNDVSKDATNLILIWENTQVKFAIQSYADEKVMVEINDRINIKKEDRPSLFYQSSLYYFNNNKDIKQAYTWIQVATGKSQEAGYLQLQARIEAALGNYPAALRSLKTSTELAKAKKLDPIISANEKLFEEWSKKKENK
jgi:hypothetical protein